MIRSTAALCLALLLTHAAPTSADEIPAFTEVTSTESSAQDATNDARLQNEYQALTDRLIEQLTASPNPRDWVLAPDLQSPERRDRLLRAAQAAPNDALVQWAAANALPHEAKPDDRLDPVAERILAQLATVHPENAAHLMPALADAARRADSVAVDGLLAKMATQSRFDTHFADTLHAWRDLAERSDTAPTLTALGQLATRADHGVTDDPALANLVSAVAFAAAIFLPSYDKLLTTCHPADDLAAQARRVDDCEKVARLLTGQGQTLIDRFIGDALLRKIDRQSDADRAQRRRWEWLQNAVSEITNDADGHAPARLVELWRDNDDEIAVFSQVVQAAGIPLDPPADWISDSEARAQSLSQNQ